VATAVSTAGQTMTEPKKSSDLGAPGSRTSPDRMFNMHFQSFVVPQHKKTKMQD